MKKSEMAFVLKRDCVKKLEKLSSKAANRMKRENDMGVYFLETERVFSTTNYATMVFCDVSLFSPGKDLPGGAYAFLPDGNPVKTGEIPDRKTYRWGEYLEKGILDMGTHEAYEKNIIIYHASFDEFFLTFLIIILIHRGEWRRHSLHRSIRDRRDSRDIIL